MWRAADEMLDRLVAVKEIRIDGLDPEDTRTRRERTLREARATARIDHPNVVRVYDVIDEGERLWIVMELVAGRSLERIMAEEGPLGPREAARIGLGLVAALRQVHERGVLHRDIKPGNVLVEPGGRGRVVLTDFGIAAIQDAKALTMVGMLVGSPDYMAPERVSGRPQGPPSDLWSLGATLCAALAGRSPFSRDTTLATLHAVLYEEPELPPAAGPLRDLLSALLEKDPAVRPALEDLETALHTVAFPAPTPTLAVGEGGEAGGEGGSGPENPDGGGPGRGASGQGESPTPAFLEAPRDPRQPDDVRDAVPPHREEVPSPTPEVVAESPRTANASTEPVSEFRSEEFCSETPSSLSAATGAPGVSLTRPKAMTERRAAPAPAPTPPHHQAPSPAPSPTRTEPAPPPHNRPTAPRPTPAPIPHRPQPGTPPGEFPGPAVPASSRHGRRRTGLVAAVGVLTAAAVVAVVLATDPGSSGGDKGDQAGASPSASVLSSPRGSPSSTVEGTSRPQSLPPGAHREAGGFAWATPEGWRRDVKTGSEVHYTSPDGKQELAAKTGLARGDLMESWQRSEQNAHQGRQYRKIRLERTTFQGHPAVVWEYTFTLQGVPWHAQLLGFTVGSTSYQVNTWYQPDIETRALTTYGKVRDSFTVL